MNGAMLYAQGRKFDFARPAATETIFCSETPALINRSCIAVRKGSKAMKPKSPVRKTNSLCELLFTNDSQKALRI